jgi:hypothetical protein
VKKPRGHGVLGRPVKPGKDNCVCGYTINRHCEPTGRANARPMTGSAKQSIVRQSKYGLLRGYASLRKRFAFVAGNDE